MVVQDLGFGVQGFPLCLGVALSGSRLRSGFRFGCRASIAHSGDQGGGVLESNKDYNNNWKHTASVTIVVRTVQMSGYDRNPTQ